MSFQVICALGDSIANGYWDEEGLGWFGRMAQRIVVAHPYQFGFNNLSTSGDTSGDVLLRLQSEVSSRDPSILLIAVGCNDLVRDDKKDAPTDLSTNRRMKNWIKILEHAQSLCKKILVVGILPVDENCMPATGELGGEFWLTNDDVASYNTDIATLCDAVNVKFLDIYSIWAEQDTSILLYDESHPNALGHESIAEIVFSKLQDLGWLAPSE